MTWWRWVAGVVMALGLVACSSDGPVPSPIAEPSSTSTSPAPTSATPTPQAWEVRSVDGADAFARYWVTVLNRASVTGETAEFERLAQSSCQTCRNYVTTLRKLYGPGGHMETDGWTILQLGIAARRVAKSGRLDVILRVNEAPEKDVFARPSRVKSYPGGATTWLMHLRWSTSGWRVTEMEPT